MTLSDNIKQLREKHRLTQSELGKIAGVSDKAVSTWENGTAEPRMGAIQKMADYFGVDKSVIVADNPQEICELFERCYGAEANVIVQRFLKLDTNDRMAVSAMIDGLLSTDKYQEVKTVGEKSTSSEAV